MLYGIPEEYKVHGNDTRLHVVVFQLLLHEFLQLRKLHNVVIDHLILLHKVACE